MKLPHAVPCPNGTERAQRAKKLRDLCTEIARTRAHAATITNDEEADYSGDVVLSDKSGQEAHRSGGFPTNFTKGLLHDEFGLLAHVTDYARFVEAINSDNNNLFDSSVVSAKDHGHPYVCKIKDKNTRALKTASWRGWESPRAGHVYELQGPDAGSVGMAPAPRVGSSELAAEMAEVYALALLRDVPFTAICAGDSTAKLCENGGVAAFTGQQIADMLNGMPFFNGDMPVSSTPYCTDKTGLNGFERNRRYARTQVASEPYSAELTPQKLFRGSTPGALEGPYISQFMLIGTDSLAGDDGNQSGFPDTDATYGFQDGFIRYGSLNIDQRTMTHKACLDHMTMWMHWLDVQNGANFKNADCWEEKRRFITTPRDLATYVHFDALYEAYLNAGLIMLAMGVPKSKGFPEASLSARRDAFATFGDPHILSLVTEVATRCLKAVRRQKFSFHRRARPETLGGRLQLVECNFREKLGCAADVFDHLRNDLPSDLLDAVSKHNEDQNCKAMRDMRAQCGLVCDGPDLPEWCEKSSRNLLLPMAFPEGSPMHPSYGAGHATVAGGCVTVLKAFFEMFEDCKSGKQRELIHPRTRETIVYVPNDEGTRLKKDEKFGGALSIQGELDKLAANIAIGRNMAGVHYYSDYYDSLRMGERVAVGILLEQAPTYGDPVDMTFKSFDGDMITISGQANSAPTLTIIDRNGSRVVPHDWWLRHVAGQEVILDN